MFFTKFNDKNQLPPNLPLDYDDRYSACKPTSKEETLRTVKSESEFVLLIVDDERSVCRALTRLLDRQVRRIGISLSLFFFR